MNIKTSLLISYAIIISLLLFSSLTFLAIEFAIKNQYKSTINNIVNEYSIIDISDTLVNLYGQILQNLDNADATTKFKDKTKEINIVFSTLNRDESFPPSVLIYKRTQNTFRLLQEYFTRGIDNAKRKDFSQSAETLEQIDRARDSIADDTTSLILSDLSYSKGQQQKIELIENLSSIVGIIVIFLVAGGSTALAFYNANKLSDPLVMLSTLAKDIAGGNLDINVDPHIQERKDELGSLSKSFSIMVDKLRQKISELNESNKATQKSKEEVEDRNKELERFNKLTVDRELMMIQLKEKIAKLEAQLSGKT